MVHTSGFLWLLPAHYWIPEYSVLRWCVAQSLQPDAADIRCPDVADT